MEIQVNDLSSWNKKRVWICDYRFKDFLSKPIRHVSPQEVQVVSSQEVKKTIYYSDYAFLKIGKKGQVTKQILAPYDNTGWRGYPGIAVRIFDNEQECRQSYQEFKQEIIPELEAFIQSNTAYLNKLLKELKNESNFDSR